MSPEVRASVAQVERLRRELGDDQAAIERHATESTTLAAEWVEPASQRTMVLAGAMVHFYYTALESLLERVARSLDQEVPAGDRWHFELLSQGTVEVPGLRPAVLPRSLLPELAALLSFRHFFRQGYASLFDEQRVRRELDRVVALHPQVVSALGSFDRFLAATVEALVRGETS